MTTGLSGPGRAHSAGALASAALLLLLAGAGSGFVPTASALGALARIFDSLAPWLLGLAFCLALAAVALGLRRVGALLALSALAGGGHLLWEHSRLSLPLVPDRPAELRVIFFNVLGGNAAQSPRIVAAAMALAPDLVVFTEAEGMYPAVSALRETYDFVSPCTFEECPLLVASRRAPVRFWRLSLNPVWPERYAVIELETRTGQRVSVAASHLLKPWLVGITEGEHRRLAAQYDWLTGPVVGVGDFNAAPWSRPMRELLAQTGFRALRRPLASWPAAAGGFGVPIDHVLVHNGARVVRIAPFGADLGSNHRGFVADIAFASET